AHGEQAGAGGVQHEGSDTGHPQQLLPDLLAQGEDELRGGHAPPASSGTQGGRQRPNSRGSSATPKNTGTSTKDSTSISTLKPMIAAKTIQPILFIRRADSGSESSWVSAMIPKTIGTMP